MYSRYKSVMYNLINSIHMYNITQFSKLTGYHIKTLQKWDRNGILKPEGRTKTNRRIYTDKQLLELFNNDEKLVNESKNKLKK